MPKWYGGFRTSNHLLTNILSLATPLCLAKICQRVLEKIFKLTALFLLFSWLSSLKDENDSSFNKFESPSLKRVLCQLRLIFAQGFWRRRCLNIKPNFHYFLFMYPLKAKLAFHLNTPFPRGCLMPSLVEIGPVDLQKKMKM